MLSTALEASFWTWGRWGTGTVVRDLRFSYVVCVLVDVEDWGRG